VIFPLSGTPAVSEATTYRNTQASTLPQYEARTQAEARVIRVGLVIQRIRRCGRGKAVGNKSEQPIDRSGRAGSSQLRFERGRRMKLVSHWSWPWWPVC
jgi:hypothetical protein